MNRETIFKETHSKFDSILRHIDMIYYALLSKYLLYYQYLYNK